MIGHAWGRKGLTASQLAANSEASAVQENTWRSYTLVMNHQQDACHMLADNWSDCMHPTFPSDASASYTSSLLFNNMTSLFLSAIVKNADFAFASRVAMRSAIKSRWLDTTGTRIAKTYCYLPTYLLHNQKTTFRCGRQSICKHLIHLPINTVSYQKVLRSPGHSLTFASNAELKGRQNRTFFFEIHQI